MEKAPFTSLERAAGFGNRHGHRDFHGIRADPAKDFTGRNRAPMVKSGGQAGCRRGVLTRERVPAVHGHVQVLPIWFLKNQKPAKWHRRCAG